MAYFLILLSCSQFILHALKLQETPVYSLLNPYVLLLPLVLIWLGDFFLRRRTPDKNLLVVLIVVAAIQAYVIPAYSHMPDFVALYAKSIQFFWGPALLLPSLLGMLRLWQVRGDPMTVARTYIKGLSWIAVAITVFELVAVRLVGLSALSLPWIEPYKNSEDLVPFRPWGISIYPQINAVMLALLFWLSYLYGARGVLHRLALVIALVLSLGTTGYLAFLILLPLHMRRPVLGVAVSGVIVGALIGLATATSQHLTGSGLAKFDIEYALENSQVLYGVLDFYLNRLSADEVMFGSQAVTALSVLGLTHDWAYFDVFYAYGLIGLIGYVLMYGILIFLACPRHVSALKHLYIVVGLLALNFHYGFLNYYLSQFVFSILAALQLQQWHLRIRVTQTPTAAIVPSSAIGA